ncbi:MAG: YceI family protein [Acidobacteria bacterium]|nr:YceI family protein [Acidobacteriota bacterium]
MSDPGTTVTRYSIIPNRSRFTVRAFAGGALSAFGHNPTIAIRGFSGDVQFSPEAISASSLRMTINAESLALADAVSEKDRKELERTMREEALEIARYPEIAFESTTVSGNKLFAGRYRIAIEGELTLHGVTRPCPLDVQLIAGPDTLRASGEFSIQQTDYRIKLVTALGGAIKLKDELKFSFDLVAQQTQE